jgi:preprotein translocase subunit YajC
VLQAAGSGGAGNGFTTVLFLLLLFGVFYFLILRPQQKRRREAAQMQDTLGAGDRIVTIGGLHATVVSIADDVVTVEIAPGVQVDFARPAIGRVLPKAEATAEEPAVEVPEALVAEPLESPVVDTRKKD